MPHFFAGTTAEGVRNRFDPFLGIEAGVVLEAIRRRAALAIANESARRRVRKEADLEMLRRPTARRRRGRVDGACQRMDGEDC